MHSRGFALREGVFAETKEGKCSDMDITKGSILLKPKLIRQTLSDLKLAREVTNWVWSTSQLAKDHLDQADALAFVDK